MSPSANFEVRRSRGWCAVVASLAICLLTVSLATRFCAPITASYYDVKAARTHAPAEAKRQRLAKSAIDWMPPVVCLEVLQAPVIHRPFAPTGPSVARLLSEVSLFNRPPPFSVSL